MVSKTIGSESVFKYLKYEIGAVKYNMKKILFTQLKKECFLAISKNQMDEVKKIVLDLKMKVNDSLYSTKENRYYSPIEYPVLLKKTKIAEFLINCGAKLKTIPYLSAIAKKKDK